MRTSMILMLALLAGPAHADPGKIPVQGELTDVEDQPIDQSLPVTFTLYGDSGGTEVLWTETQTVDFDLGSFTALLGDFETLDLDLFAEHPQAFLGIAIDGGEEMDLIPLGSAPYAGYAQQSGAAERAERADLADEATRALGADDADSLGGFTAAEYRLTRDAIRWDELVDVPSGLNDGDDETTYSAGTGMSLSSSNAFSVDETWFETQSKAICYDSAGEITAITNPLYLAKSYKPDWGDIADIPSGFSDGKDDDTTYTGGPGVTISGTTVSADKTWVETTAKGVCYDTTGEITAITNPLYLSTSYEPDWDDLTGVPTGFADGTDDDTTYSAGTGLTLSSGSFTVDMSYLRTELDKRYRSQSAGVAWSDLTGVPTDLADGDDGIIASDLAAEIGKLSTLDLPAGTTIDGQGIPEASIAKPLVQFGDAFAVPIQTYYGGTFTFDRRFSKAPAYVIGIDETIDNNGSSWCHSRRRSVNRAWFRCNTTADGLYWMAMELGRHTIDGKEVEAGYVSSVRNGDTIFFTKTFKKAPIVILMGGWNNVHERIIGSSGVTTGGFQVGNVNSNGQPMHYIAMEPGDYEYNGYHWEAGQRSSLRDGSTYSFTGTFTETPRMYLEIVDTNNSGATYVRLRDISTTSFTTYANSSSEFVNYVAVEEK